jgi:D-alanyl-D-alanine carboxypeptidase
MGIDMQHRRTLAGFLVAATVMSGPAAAGPKLLFDPSNGKVLYAEDIDDQWHPASVTKILTAYIAFEAIKSGKIKLDTKLVVSENALAQEPSKVGLPLGAEMSVEMALQALIIKSANDVAVMLAEGIGGSEEGFVQIMNDTARRLGMTRSHFVNPHGLPALEQVTTARDLAKLTTAVLTEHKDYAHLWTMSDMRLGKIRLGSHNGLLKSYAGADGMKTGFICDAGYNIVGSATRDNTRLIAIVLGELSGRDRNIHAASLLEHGFNTYGWKQLFSAPTLAALPMSSDPKPVTSMRAMVHNFACNGIRRGRVPKARVAGKKGTPPIKAAKASGRPSLTIDVPARRTTPSAVAGPASSAPPPATTPSAAFK